MTVPEFIGKSARYDDSSQYIWGETDGFGHMIAEVRGYGAIQNLFSTRKEAEQFQDNLGKFIAEAITEKLERERNKKEGNT